MTKRKVLICCSGSVATIKLPDLIDRLLQLNCEIKITATKHALFFINRDDISVSILTDDDEWTLWKARGDPILHIDLCEWADILLIAPLSANTLGKLANGLCDNLVCSIVRAWPSSLNIGPGEIAKPLLMAPAMNTRMWNNPLTKMHLESMKSNYSAVEIPCTSKVLMCGKFGAGAMAEIPNIVEVVKQYL